jgi:N-acetylmuramoyl-L-alanine amidase
VTGPLAIKVVYPPAGQLIQSKDSNFIFGSVGNGDAALIINGVPTPVWPNGAFMGWLANPPASNPVYDIFAITGTDSAHITHPVKIAAPTATPAQPDTVIRYSLARYAAVFGSTAYASDTDRVVTGYAPDFPTAGGLDRWFLMPGTVVKVTGTRGNYLQVELDSLQSILIEKPDLKMLDSASASDSASQVSPPPQIAPAPVNPPKALRVSPFKIATTGEWTDISIPISDRPAFLVTEGTDSLTLTLYRTSGPARKQLPVKESSASYVNTVSAKSNGPQMQYTVALKGAIYGYQPVYENGKFTLRVRKPPRIDAASPLMGLTIAIDPGHPPVGATGPTGLWEPVATLDVGFKVRELLQAKGVNVLMTRTTPDPVDLTLRPILARRAGAHAFVSIHLNAVGDGQNPFRAQGTATYHYWMHSAPLADAIQKAAVAHMGLRDNGVKRSNFAVVRIPSSMPAALVEGAFIIMPDQEAAMRTPEYQERYAQSVVDGLENYFRSLASPQK